MQAYTRQESHSSADGVDLADCSVTAEHFLNSRSDVISGENLPGLVPVLDYLRFLSISRPTKLDKGEIDQ